VLLEDFVKLKAALVGDEGSSLKLYLDTLGIPTIGIGHNLKAVGISKQVVDLIFEDDVTAALLLLSKRPDWNMLDSVRQAVILNMAFQLGNAGVNSFKKMWAAIDKKDFSTAASEMRNSTWYRQTPARAERLATQMATGKWA
jgi:lysozyme